MPIELLTLKDLHDFKAELLQELKQILIKHGNTEAKKFLKSPEVCKLLRISPGTLQNLRRNQTICYKKIGGIIYYYYDDIEKLLTKK